MTWLLTNIFRLFDLLVSIVKIIEKHMKLKLPLLLVLTGLVSATLISSIALIFASQVITENKFDQLQSLKEVKRSAVNRHLSSIQNQVASMAVNPPVMNGLIQFESGFQGYAYAVGFQSSARNRLKAH